MTIPPKQRLPIPWTTAAKPVRITRTALTRDYRRRMSADGGTNSGETSLAERLRELLAELERLPAVPRWDERSKYRLAICAEVEAILHLRRATRPQRREGYEADAPGPDAETNESTGGV